jgi:hypothetical protein
VLSCEDFSDRLYDEDCRFALVRRGAVPADVALHCASCAACRGLWTEAADDLATLPELLSEPAPPELSARVRRGLAERVAAQPASPWSALDWTAGLTWAALGAAVAVVAAGHLPAGLAQRLVSGSASPATAPHPALMAPFALLGAAIAFGASAVRQAVRDALS